LKTATVEVVRLRHLIEFNGSQANPVKFITLRGLTFRHAARTFMDNREPLLRSDWTSYRGGAVMFNGAEDAALEDCDFDQLGGNTVFINNYNRRLTVRGCLIRESGANGVAFIGDPLFVDPAHGDYRVKEGSPAFKLAFVSFPMDQFGVRTPRLKAMARTPEIPPLNTGGEKSPAATGEIDWQDAKLRNMEGQEFSAIGVPADAVGVFVADVPERSAAYAVGLRQGDLIQQVNHQALRNAKEFLGAVNAAPKEQTLNLKIIRNQRTKTLSINAPTKP